MSDKQLVTYTREGHIGIITLNRPEKRNALNLAVWDALDEALELVEKDPEARVVVLRGEGKSFCAGLDLSPENELFAMATGGASAAQKVLFYNEVIRVQGIHTRMAQLHLPTIASMQKHCVGAGLELALCCDIRICTAETQFSLPEVRLGFITDIGGLQRLTTVVGKAHARQMAFTGTWIDAERAERIGLVNEVFPDNEALDKGMMEMAELIAGRPPLAVQGAKEVFIFDENSSIEESLAFNAAKSSMIVPSEDIGEAVSSYFQKRQGVFKGA